VINNRTSGTSVRGRTATIADTTTMAGGTPPHLDHEVLDDAVEQQVVVVARPRVAAEVLDGLGGAVGQQLDEDVAHRRVDDGFRAQLGALDGCRRLRGHGEVLLRWRLVEDVAALPAA